MRLLSKRIFLDSFHQKHKFLRTNMLLVGLIWDSTWDEMLRAIFESSQRPFRDVKKILIKNSGDVKKNKHFFMFFPSKKKKQVWETKMNLFRVLKRMLRHHHLDIFSLLCLICNMRLLSSVLRKRMNGFRSFFSHAFFFIFRVKFICCFEK